MLVRLELLAHPTPRHAIAPISPATVVNTLLAGCEDNDALLVRLAGAAAEVLIPIRDMAHTAHNTMIFTALLYHSQDLLDELTYERASAYYSRALAAAN